MGEEKSCPPRGIVLSFWDRKKSRGKKAKVEASCRKEGVKRSAVAVERRQEKSGLKPHRSDGYL